MTESILNFDISKLHGAKLVEKNGRKAIVIWLDESWLFEGKQGIYSKLQLHRNEKSKFGDTHYVKEDVPMELRASKPDQPIIGNVHPLAKREFTTKKTVEYKQEPIQPSYVENGITTESNDDLPF